MEELKEYCENTCKCEWVLTPDFLFIEHPIIMKDTVDVISENGYFIMVILNEGVLFAFNSEGILTEYFKIREYIKRDNSIIGGGLRKR